MEADRRWARALSGHVRRRREGRVQVVRRREQARSFPLRIRPLVHHVFLLGAEVAEVYASLPAAAAEPPKRLVGWSKVKLNPGKSKEVAVEVDGKYLSIFNVEQNGWQLLPGEYTFLVGGSSQELPLKETVGLK